MDKQAVVWSSDDRRPCAKRFWKPTQDSWRNMKPVPGTGMWTSTWLGEQDISNWVQWCRNEDFRTGEHKLFTLDVKSDAKVIHIDSQKDLEDLYIEYPGESKYPGMIVTLDWALMRYDKIDGIHLTGSGQWATRFSRPVNLYGWDCESTLWLRWAFAKVESKGIVSV